jgi:hypothetical protein
MPLSLLSQELKSWQNLGRTARDLSYQELTLYHTCASSHPFPRLLQFLLSPHVFTTSATAAILMLTLSKDSPKFACCSPFYSTYTATAYDYRQCALVGTSASHERRSFLAKLVKYLLLLRYRSSVTGTGWLVLSSRSLASTAAAL